MAPTFLHPSDRSYTSFCLTSYKGHGFPCMLCFATQSLSRTMMLTLVQSCDGIICQAWRCEDMFDPYAYLMRLATDDTAGRCSLSQPLTSTL